MDSTQDKTGFELGWDFALHGVVPPEVEPGLVRDQLLCGYAAGVLHFDGSRHRIQNGGVEFRYHRKLLHLRLSAFKRSRIISDNVTPAFLKSLDEDFCPVTRQKFTYGQGLPTDATVERLNNNGGYAAGNICMLSYVANQAKGSKSFSTILDTALSLAEGDIYMGLTTAEWARLSSFASYGCDVDEQAKADCLPMLCTPIQYCNIGSPLMILKCITSRLMIPNTSKHIRVAILRSYKSLGDKKVNKAIEKFYDCGRGAYNRAYQNQKDKKCRLYFLIEDAWGNPVLFNCWTALAAAVGGRFDAVFGFLRDFSKGALSDETSIDTSSWGLETGGYAAARLGPVFTAESSTDSAYDMTAKS